MELRLQKAIALKLQQILSLRNWISSFGAQRHSIYTSQAPYPTLSIVKPLQLHQPDRRPASLASPSDVKPTRAHAPCSNEALDALTPSEQAARDALTTQSLDEQRRLPA